MTVSCTSWVPGDVSGSAWTMYCIWLLQLASWAANVSDSAFSARDMLSLLEWLHTDAGYLSRVLKRRSICDCVFFADSTASANCRWLATSDASMTIVTPHILQAILPNFCSRYCRFSVINCSWRSTCVYHQAMYWTTPLSASQLVPQ